MKSRRNALRSALGVASVLLGVQLLGGGAVSAMGLPQGHQQAASFRAEPSNLQERRPTTFKAPTKPSKPRPALLARISRDLQVTARPGKGKVIGVMPRGSRYYGEAHTAWIQERSEDGRYGKVTVPYSESRATGWIRIAGLELNSTPYSVQADLSRHLITVRRLDKVIMRFPTATGAPGSPSPTGRYFVTDQIAIPGGGSFGTYAFGISGIQPNLPAGWSGGDQMAIHGTSDPSSIGTSASAGCLRVSEGTLDRLKPLLKLGTPITIKP